MRPGPAGRNGGVVKANAYGLGVEAVFPALEQEGCQTFFVATLAEAQSLRALSKTAIYVLDGLLPGTAPLFEEIGARPVLSSLDEVSEWGAYCKARGAPLRAAIHIDTGMTRLGLFRGNMCGSSRRRRNSCRASICASS